MDTDIVSSLTSHGPGYISEETKDLEKVVGLQTDKPLKRAFMPYGGIKMAEESVVTMVMNQVKDYMKSSQNIQRLITQLFSMLTHQK